MVSADSGAVVMAFPLQQRTLIAAAVATARRRDGAPRASRALGDLCADAAVGEFYADRVTRLRFASGQHRLAVLVAHQSKTAIQHGMERIAFQQLVELIDLTLVMLQQVAAVAFQALAILFESF